MFKVLLDHNITNQVKTTTDICPKFHQTHQHFTILDYFWIFTGISKKTINKVTQLTTEIHSHLLEQTTHNQEKTGYI